MNQTSGNDQKPDFGHDFDPLLDQRWSPKPFSWVLPLLDLIHCCKLSLYAISRKTNEPNLRKWQKTQFPAQFWPIWPKFGSPIFFFFKNLASSVKRYHGQLWPCALLEKTMIQSSENVVTRDGQMDRKTDGQVISQDTVRLTLSVQQTLTNCPKNRDIQNLANLFLN